MLKRTWRLTERRPRLLYDAKAIAGFMAILLRLAVAGVESLAEWSGSSWGQAQAVPVSSCGVQTEVEFKGARTRFVVAYW